MTTKSMRQRKPVSLTNSRWTAYATAGAATAIAGVSTAEAAIHYSGPINQVFNAAVSSTIGPVNFALTGGAQIRFVQGAATSSDSGHGFALFRNDGAALSNMFAGSAAGSYRYPFNLASNVNVSAQLFSNFNANFFATLAFHGGFTNSHFLNPGTGFIGFRFNTGAGIQYGWARVTMNGAPGNGFTLVDYAWGDVGQVMITGQVPEPGSLGLLAAGAAGLLLWRRSRAKAA